MTALRAFFDAIYPWADAVYPWAQVAFAGGLAVVLPLAILRAARRQDTPARLYLPPPEFSPILVVDELIEEAMVNGAAAYVDHDRALHLRRCPEREEDAQWRATWQHSYTTYHPTAQEAGAWLFSCAAAETSRSRRRA